MTAEEQALWNKIEAFRLDDPDVSFKFSDRLARENGWTKAYTLRVINEYRKFIFLCCVSTGGVTPSDPVDQAWHLHLTFTQSYWIDLCKNTLGREIHHNPTKGGKAEAQKFDSFYTSSRQQYIDLFAMEPPADIWQNNHARFSDINFQRVNLSKYWLIKRPDFKQFKGALQINIVLLALLFYLAWKEEYTYILGMCGIVGGLVSLIYFNKNRDNENDEDKRRDWGSGCGGDSNGHGGHHNDGGHHGGDGGGHGCSSGCSGCGSGCSGCGGGD